MLIQVQNGQAHETGWVKGKFTLLAAGGYYLEYLTPYTRKSDLTAEQLIYDIAPKAGKTTLHIFNRNMLKLSRQTFALRELSTDYVQAEPSNEAASKIVQPEAPKAALMPEENMQVTFSVGKPDAITDIEQHLSELKSLEETERSSIVKSRIGQGAFRDSLIKLWCGRCSVTGLSNVAILRASHVKPWRDATNEERLDPHNGLLLIPNLDVLFDAGLISFDEDGQIKVSKQLSEEQCKLLGVDDNLSLRRDFSGMQGDHQKRLQEYLSHHREKVFEP